jgi:iron complex transport system substrate-binding protein
MLVSRTTAAAALILLTAACGNGATGSGSSDPASDPTSSDAVVDTPETQAVRHDQGETEVPAEPRRVVALDTPHLDAALSVGVEPVGAVSVFADEGLPTYLGDLTDGIEIVGTIEEPDLEAIAALEPDLILSATVRHGGIYDQLGQIAPTVFTESSGTDWEQGFDLVAEALGRQDEGRRALADHDARVTGLGQDLEPNGTVAAIVRFLPGETRIYGPDTFSGSVLSEVGFELPDLDYDEYSMAYISAEQAELLRAADVIFTSTYGPPDESTRAEVTALWDNLPAVEAGCQFDVEDDEWMIGIGLIGAGIILDDVETSLSDSTCM